MRPQQKSKHSSSKRTTPSSAPSNSTATFLQIMEDAVRLEEKGERYASGEKAKGFYERACDLYQNANSMDPSDLDCIYNWGRVLYILVDFPPNDYPQKLLLLSQSLAKFRQAFSLQPHHVDALFNAAQALTTQAELLQEIDLGENGEHAVAALEEACSLFEKVFTLQEEALLSQKQQSEKEEAEESEISPSSLVDTLTALSHSLSSLAFLVSSLPEALSLYTRAVQVLERASLFIEKSAAEMEGAEIKASEVQLQRASVLASQADRVVQETGSDVQPLYREALTRIDSVLAKQDANVEAWCDRGDVLCSLAQAKKPLETSTASTPATATQPSTDDDPQAAETFSFYSDASKAYLSAHRLEPRHVSILVKLGDVNLARARLAFPTLPTSSTCDSSSSAVPYPISFQPNGPSLSARKNLTTLLSNAVTYYRRALDQDPKNLGALLRLSQTMVLDLIRPNHESIDSNSIPRPSSFGCWKEVLKEWSLRGGTIDLLDRAVVDFSDVFDHVFVRAAVQLVFPSLLNTEADQDTVMET